MHSKLSSRPRITPARVFFLAALLALIALSPAILPYGGRLVTRGDYIEQQLPFILETRRILRAGLSGYSFNTFLGAPSVGSYAFYTLGSPFVWPLALLPQSLVPFGISLMAIFKHAAAALTAFLYFDRMVRDRRLSLLGGLLYAFSSFTIVNTQFYHFTEVIAVFPLILLGLEIAMSEKPRPGLLALFCGVNALVNYYFMLSSALLAALYFAFRFFSEDWKPARNVRRVFYAVFECGVGCALSGVILLPSLMHMITITRTGAGVDLLQSYSPALLMERLRALLMPIESNVLHAYFGDAPSWCSTAAYLPVFGLTGVLVFCFAQKAQRWLKALLAALLIASAIPVLCGAFALFTNMAYTRWWYGLALLLTLATLYALKTIQSRRAWLAAFAVCSALVLLLTVPFLLPESVLSLLPVRLGEIIANRRSGAYGPDALRVLSVSLSLLGGAAMLLIIKKPRFAAALMLVCAVSAAQYAGYIAVGDRTILSGGSDPQNGVYTLEQIAKPTLSAINFENSGEYKRIDYGKRIRNYGLLRGHSSLTCFTSLRTSTVGKFVSMAGFGYDESTTVTPPDDQGAVRALLSVSEYHQFDESESIPEGFVYDREENGFAVYSNPNAVPMGFLQTTLTGAYHQRMDSETVGTVLLAAAALDDANYERFKDRMDVLDVYSIPDWQESAALLRENACDRFEVTRSGFRAHIDASEAGLVVFTIPHDKGFSATVDGAKAEIIPCDVSFMAVWVEPGEHEIVFTYRTRMLGLGLAMSAMAGAVLAAYVILAKKKKLP